MGATGGGVGIKLVISSRCQELKIVRIANPDKDAGPATGQLIWGITRPFQSFPGDLQHQTLLGIHANGFTGGDAEELRIKTIYLREETAPAGRNFTRRIWVRVIISLDRPAGSRYFGDDINPIL